MNLSTILILSGRAREFEVVTIKVNVHGGGGVGGSQVLVKLG